MGRALRKRALDAHAHGSLPSSRQPLAGSRSQGRRPDCKCTWESQSVRQHPCKDKGSVTGWRECSWDAENWHREEESKQTPQQSPQNILVVNGQTSLMVKKTDFCAMYRVLWHEEHIDTPAIPPKHLGGKGTEQSLWLRELTCPQCPESTLVLYHYQIPSPSEHEGVILSWKSWRPRKAEALSRGPQIVCFLVFQSFYLHRSVWTFSTGDRKKGTENGAHVVFEEIVSGDFLKSTKDSHAQITAVVQTTDRINTKKTARNDFTDKRLKTQDKQSMLKLYYM